MYQNLTNDMAPARRSANYLRAIKKGHREFLNRPGTDLANARATMARLLTPASLLSDLDRGRLRLLALR